MSLYNLLFYDVIIMINRLVREKIQYDYDLMDDDEFVACPHCGILLEKDWNVFNGRVYCPKCGHKFTYEEDE